MSEYIKKSKDQQIEILENILRDKLPYSMVSIKILATEKDCFFEMEIERSLSHLSTLENLLNRKVTFAYKEFLDVKLFIKNNNLNLNLDYESTKTYTNSEYLSDKAKNFLIYFYYELIFNLDSEKTFNIKQIESKLQISKSDFNYGLKIKYIYNDLCYANPNHYKHEIGFFEE